MRTNKIHQASNRFILAHTATAECRTIQALQPQPSAPQDGTSTHPNTPNLQLPTPCCNRGQWVTAAVLVLGNFRPGPVRFATFRLRADLGLQVPAFSSCWRRRVRQRTTYNYAGGLGLWVWCHQQQQAAGRIYESPLPAVGLNGSTGRSSRKRCTEGTCRKAADVAKPREPNVVEMDAAITSRKTRSTL